MNTWNMSFIAAAMAVSASAASAADIVEVPTYDWTGFYVGLSGGYGWGDLDPKFQNNGYQSNVEGDLLTDPVTEWYDFNDCDSFIGGWGGSIGYCGDTSNLSGMFGGIQAGYNFQADSFVFGLEADAFLSSIDGDGDAEWTYSYVGPNFGSTDTNINYDVDAFGTVRARAGLAMDRFLPYITGGLAWGHVDVSADSYNFNTLSPDTQFSGSDSKTAWGWALGAGAEYAITENMTMKAEYVYVDLGSVKSEFVYDDGGPFNLKSDINMHTVKVGLNWKF
jgi:outer membrane immunogenic protein